MLELFLICPATRRAASTGIRLDVAVWDTATPFLAYTRCPACGGDHEWQAVDVWLAPAERRLDAAA